MAALSPNSRHRSQTIREMSQDLNRTDHSVASSTGSNHGTVSTDSTMTNFDPDNDDAIMSTRQMENNFSQKLPELRDTARKYGRWAPRPQQDFAINTSAIGRAFPDFSQGGSSDDSMSIEVGRGAKTRQRTPSRVPRAEYSDNIDSPVVTVGKFQILGTPQRSQTKASILQDALHNSARKDSIPKHASIAQKENIPPSSQKSARGSPYVSRASRTSSGERRTLAELHAQVADESDGSFIGEERPATVTFQAKHSRFSNGQSRATQPDAVSSKRQQSADALAEAIRTTSETPFKQQLKTQANHTTNSTTPNPTQQSFLLPNMPDISELVSGTFKDGVPVFTRGGKVQSRFSPAARSGPRSHFGFDQIDGVPLHQDEKDIYLSIELLQDRVAQLEMEKADAQRIANELQKDKYQLQAEKTELEKNLRSDSALGMADSGSDAGNERNHRSLIAEKMKLEAHLASLQSHLDATERKLSTQELRLKTNTAERDQAVQQLAQAFYHSEQLKADNEVLRQENESLKAQLAQFVAGSEKNARNWQKKESVLLRKIQRREEVVKEFQEITQDIYQTTDINVFTTTRTAESKSGRSSKGNRKSSDRASEQDLASKVMRRAEKQMDHIKLDRATAHRRPSTGQISQVNPAEPSIRPRSLSRSGRKVESVEKETRAIINHSNDQQLMDNNTNFVTDEGSVDEETTMHRGVGDVTNDEDTRSEGSEYASIVGEGFMAKLRERLRTGTAEQRNRLAEAASAHPKDDTAFSARSSHAPSVRGLAGILKNGGTQNYDDLTGRLSVKSAKSNHRLEEDRTTRSDASHHRRHSEPSNHMRSSRRRRSVTDDMTSAFIIPDICLNVHETGAEHPVLSADARRVLDGLCKHDGKNCTVCTRVASFDTKAGSDNLTKQTVLVEKPVPVSERMPVPGPYEDEPTIRPSIEPGLALATVIKALEDEVAHLKMEHARILATYNNHDSSLGMRKRKALKNRLETLLKLIDIKSDQIYALYDVLEGQKQSGQEMSEKDVEVTLLSIGVDPDGLTKESQSHGQSNDDNQQEDIDSDDDSELDLPWEGIEDTTGSIGGNNRRQAWRA